MIWHLVRGHSIGRTLAWTRDWSGFSWRCKTCRLVMGFFR